MPQKKHTPPLPTAAMPARRRYTRYHADNYAPRLPDYAMAHRPVLPKTQAARVYAKFGGVPALCRALEDAGTPRDPSTVYRWNLPLDSGGTGGTIPPRALRDVARAALIEGILLTPEDLYPFPDPE